MKDLLIVFAILLVLLLLISAFGGSIRYEKFDTVGAPLYADFPFTLQEANKITENFISSSGESNFARYQERLLSNSLVTGEEAKLNEYSTIEGFDGSMQFAAI